MATTQRRKRPVQKIIIPPGLVRSNETVVIEVPSNLKKQSMVIAKRPPVKNEDQSAYEQPSEEYQRNPNQTTYHGRIQHYHSALSGRSILGVQPALTAQPVSSEQAVPSAEAAEVAEPPAGPYEEPMGEIPAFDMHDVEAAERAERDLFFQTLHDFHRARRNVLQETQNILGGMQMFDYEDSD